MSCELFRGSAGSLGACPVQGNDRLRTRDDDNLPVKSVQTNHLHEARPTVGGVLDRLAARGEQAGPTRPTVTEIDHEMRIDAPNVDDCRLPRGSVCHSAAID